MTAGFRRGVGFHALGNEAIGGKRYLCIWVAILGYFALISQPIPREKRKLYTTLFMLGAVTQAISEMAGFLGPAFSFVYIFFPGGNADPQQISPVQQDVLQRFGGIAVGSTALWPGLPTLVIFPFTALKGFLDLRKIMAPLLLFLLGFVWCALGGFRSHHPILMGMTLFLLTISFFEGLVRSRLMPIALLPEYDLDRVAIDRRLFLITLPCLYPIQRCLTLFFPVGLKIDPEARMNAEASTDLAAWKSGSYLDSAQIPHIIWFPGKGLTFDMSDMAMYLSMGNQDVMGEVGGQFTLAGDYHNGPLSVLIPFGIWGAMLAFALGF